MDEANGNGLVEDEDIRPEVTEPAEIYWKQCAKGRCNARTRKNQSIEPALKDPDRVAFLVLAMLFFIFLIDVHAQTYLRNASSCEQCHTMPSRFGSSPLTVERVGKFSHGSFVPGLEGGIHHREGSLLTSDDSGAMRVERVSVSLLGDGYVEAIADRDLLASSAQQRRENPDVAGSLVSAPVLELNSSKSKTQAGRFGWKSQHSSLTSACADSLRNELGIRNQLYPDEYATHKPTDPATPFDIPDPKTGQSELERLVAEIRHTTHPR